MMRADCQYYKNYRDLCINKAKDQRRKEEKGYSSIQDSVKYNIKGDLFIYGCPLELPQLLIKCKNLISFFQVCNRWNYQIYKLRKGLETDFYG